MLGLARPALFGLGAGRMSRLADAPLRASTLPFRAPAASVSTRHDRRLRATSPADHPMVSGFHTNVEIGL
jgi:hypothetical protein